MNTALKNVGFQYSLSTKEIAKSQKKFDIGKTLTAKFGILPYVNMDWCNDFMNKQNCKEEL